VISEGAILLPGKAGNLESGIASVSLMMNDDDEEDEESGNASAAVRISMSIPGRSIDVGEGMSW